MTTKTEWSAHCLRCDWQPDPTRRMSLDSQAEEHTKKAGHPTVTTTSPVTRADVEAHPLLWDDALSRAARGRRAGPPVG